MKIEAGKSYVARDGEVWTNARPAGRRESREGYTWELSDAKGEKFSFTADGRFWLEAEESCNHDLVSLAEEAKASPSGPLCYVTRREIVPGEYGRLRTVGVGSLGQSADRVPVSLEQRFYTAADLREAANLFNQLAEVLEENAEGGVYAECD